MRIVGFVGCLLALMMLSGSSAGAIKSRILDGFSDNILAALWIAFVLAVGGGILSSILWRLSAVRSYVRGHYPDDKLRSTEWEHRVTLLACSVLILVVGISLLAAVAGYHP